MRAHKPPTLRVPARATISGFEETSAFYNPRISLFLPVIKFFIYRFKWQKHID
jgi:hypothetical protein